MNFVRLIAAFGVVAGTIGVGCAETIIASNKPVMACSTGEEPIPVGYYEGNFKWECGKPLTHCSSGQKSEFSVENEKDGSGVQAIRWDCLREEEQREDDVHVVPFRKLIAEVRGKTIVATLTTPVHCRNVWLDSQQRVRQSEDWKSCGRKPVPHEQASVQVGESPLVAVTDADGKATFDLTTVKPNEALIANPTVEVRVFGRNSLGLASDSLSLANSELFSAWKREADTRRVEQIEASVASVDHTLTALEGTKDPWGDDELEKTQQMVAVFNDVQQNVQVLKGREPIDSALVRRLAPLTPLIGKFGSRAQALMPHVKKAAEARNMRNAAFLTALFSAGASSSGSSGSGSSSSSSGDDSRLREMEDRHQRDRADDERRRQRERDDDANQRQREAQIRAAEQEEQRKRARESCGSRCTETYSRCARDCNSTNWNTCLNNCTSQSHECRLDCDNR